MEIYTKISEEKYPKVSVATIGKLQENTRALCKMAVKFSQQKADFAALRSGLSACGVQLQRDGKLQGEIHNTVQKGCEIISQQKGDFATLCKILPTTWSNRLAMLVTPSFQLRIAHYLKHWIVDFLSFETKYSMNKLDSRKCSKSG